VRPSQVTAGACPVLAAGIGVRHTGLRRGQGWALRSVSLRVDAADGTLTGIAVSDRADAGAFTGLLCGQARPARGALRVLGEDLTTAYGRAAVSGLVGVARDSGGLGRGRRIRGLARHAARAAGLRRRDAAALTTAILSRLALTELAHLRVNAAPAVIRRRALLAAAAVHRPGLLLLDCLFDGLAPAELASLARAARDLAGDTPVIAVGRDVASLALACDRVLTLSGGVLFGA
jgi:ABC-type branched-subunit amino acid transport system ATPase component